MTRRRSLLDRLWPRRAWAARNDADPADAGGERPPARPARMVVSGGIVFGERIRSFEQAHPVARADPRLRLWRDSAAVLVVFAIAIAFYDWLPRPEQAVLGETSAPSQLLGEPQTSGPGTSKPGTSNPTGEATPTPASSDAVPSTPPTPGSTPRATPRATPRSTPGATPQPTPTLAPPTATPAPPTATPAPPPPVAAIATPTCATGSFSISFDGSGSSGTIDAYAWDFGDGESSTEVAPTHTYANGPPSPYTVTLTVSGPGGSDVATITLDVPCI